MWKNISACIKVLKKIHRKPRKTLDKVLYALRTLIGPWLCPIIHFVFRLGSTVRVLPFGIQTLDKGFVIFTPTVGIRKWTTKFLLLLTVFRGLLMIPVGFSTNMKWIVNGFLTADLLLWLVCIGYAGFWSILSLKLQFNAKECELVYNGIAKLTRKFEIEYMNGKNILELKGRQLDFSAWYLGSFALVVVVTPPMSAGILGCCFNSPLTISYYIVGFDGATQIHTLHSVLIWGCLIADWITVTYAIWVVVMCLTALDEGLASFAFLFSVLRNHPRVPWVAKLKYHAQAELIVKIFNDFAGTTVTLALSLGVMLASTCLTVLVKVDVVKGFPPIGWIPGICLLTIGALLVGFMFLKFAETFRDESIGLQADVEAEITAYFMLKTNRRKCNGNTHRPTGRLFRRRPTGVRFGSFMHINTGMCVTYMMQIVDNTVNLVFMVDLWSVPMWLAGA